MLEKGFAWIKTTQDLEFKDLILFMYSIVDDILKV